MPPYMATLPPILRAFLLPSSRPRAPAPSAPPPRPARNVPLPPWVACCACAPAPCIRLWPDCNN
ncbi:Uncharacterised protein [Bordetella pertussis]|nr:Uncharacterised protein [Bordetella pertussis]